MNIHRGRFLSFFTLLTPLLCSIPTAFASDDTDVREVRISSVQGDVRLARGDRGHTNLNKPWERAQGGELLKQGFAVATGNGRAEIEFEDGSAAYVAENSLLLFSELSARQDCIVTRMTLPTGTATFALQPAAAESFFIETPTDRIQVSPLETLFARIVAYLDATAITPQGEKGEAIIRNGSPKLVLPKGHTLFFRGGEVVQIPDLAQVASFQDRNVLLSQLRALAPLAPGGWLSESMPSVRLAARQTPHSQSTEQLPPLAANSSLAGGDWDSWVSSRVQERATLTTAALKASGLSSPIPGLNDLHTYGSFFQCAPYGTCWEPTPEEPQQATPSETSRPNAQSPGQNTPNTGFPPRTVEWTERIWRFCSPDTARRVSRVAHTEQELEYLLSLKTAAERAALGGTAYSESCWNGAWIPHRDHYARVLSLRKPPGCLGKACKPVHPPRPVWVRAGGKVGFVPRHPNDVKHKPPINLKNGILIPPAKPGEPLLRATVEASERVKILDKAPREFQSGFVTHAQPVAPPEIRGHLMQEAAHGKSMAAANHAPIPILCTTTRHRNS
jgi:FecR protein